MACTGIAKSGHTPASEWRERRRCWEAERLQADLRAVAAIHPRLRLSPTAPQISTLLQHFALQQIGLAIVTADVGTRSIVIVGVSRGAWYSPFLRPKLFALKREARRSGLMLILVPQGIIRRQPRLSTARLIATYHNFKVLEETRAAIIGHVKVSPTASLWSCSELVHNRRYAVGSVLALVATGVLRVSLTQPLSASSPIWLNSAHPSAIPSTAEGLFRESEQSRPIATGSAKE
jgi:hypothetical protein